MKKQGQTTPRSVASQFNIGDRVVLINDFLRNPLIQRRGVIATIQDRPKGAANGGSSGLVRFIVVALDNLLVSRPSTIDHEFAQLLMIDPRRVYTVIASNARATMEKISLDVDQADRSTLFCCDSCMRVVQFCDMIPFQSFLVCKSHICPWDEVQHEPNLSEVGPFFCRIFDISRRSNVPLPAFAETKALMLKKHYDHLLQQMVEHSEKVVGEDSITKFFLNFFGKLWIRPTAKLHGVDGNTPKHISGSAPEIELLLTIRDKTVIQLIPFSLLHYYLVDGFEGRFIEFLNHFQFSSDTLPSALVKRAPALLQSQKGRSLHLAKASIEIIIQITSPYFPVMSSADIIVKKDSFMEDLWDIIEILPYHIHRQKFNLYCRLKDFPPLYGQCPFCLPVEEMDQTDHFQHVRGIHEFDSLETLEIFREHPVVSPPLHLLALIGDFLHNSVLVAKALDLSSVYAGFRRIKGDGNCYYRAVIISFLEQLLCVSDRSKQYHIIERLIRRLKVANGKHDYVIQYLRNIQDGSVTLRRFIEDIIQPDYRLDIALIIATKGLLTNYILSHRHDDVNGTTLEELWLAYYGNQEIRTLEECCCHFIDRLDLSAEGPFVNMGLIFRALGCGGVLVMLDRREEVPLSLVHCPSSEDLEGVTNTPIVIHLLLRPGHYDLLYLHHIVSLESLLERYNCSSVHSSVAVAEEQTQVATSIKLPPDYIPHYMIKTHRIKVDALWNQELEESGICFSQESLQNFKYQKRLVLTEDMFKVYKECDPCNVFNIPVNNIRVIIAEVVVGKISRVVVLPETCAIVRIVLPSSASSSCSSMHCNLFCCLDLKRIRSLSDVALALSRSLGQSVVLTHPDNASLLELLKLQRDGITSEVEVVSFPQIILETEKKINVLIICEKVLKTMDVSLNITFEELVKIAICSFGIRSHCNLLTDKFGSVTPDTFKGLLEFLHDTQTVSTWYLRYCSRCELDKEIEGDGFYGDHQISITDIYELPCCGSGLCKICVDDLANSCKIQNMFSVADHDEVPILMAKIPCPSCQQDLCEQLLCHSDRFNADFEMALHGSKNKPKVRCAAGYYDCFDEFFELDQVLQLGCDHFFCFDCIGGSIRDQIQKAKQHPKKICCPVCVSLHKQAMDRDEIRSCFCPYCMNFGNSGPHEINPSEMEFCLDLEIFDTNVLDDWDRINMILAAKDDPSSRQLECRCNAVYFVSVHMHDNEAVCPYGCGYKICIKCGFEAHGDIKCEDNIGGTDRKDWFIRSCEKCGHVGALPEACNHITCCCGYQFCFLCLAPHLQYVNHDLSYHRPGCDFYQHCCSKNCRQNGKSRCNDAKFNPGPCTTCINQDEVNSCNHSDWKPCTKCQKDRVPCIHNCCPECKRLGRACDPPSNVHPDGKPYEFYKLQEVESRKKELGSVPKSGSS